MRHRTELPQDFRDAIARAFEGERVLWTGRPSRLRSPLATLPVWLFTLPWTVCAILFELMLVNDLVEKGTSRTIGVSLALLVGFMLVVAGVYLLLLPLFGWRDARRLVFAVGEKRLGIVKIGGKPNAARFHDLDAIMHTDRCERRDGTGTLSLAIGHRGDDDMMVASTEFLCGIPDVRHVERLLRARMHERARSRQDAKGIA